MQHQIKPKIATLLLAITLTVIAVWLFFLDASLAWGVNKVCSCVVVSIWVFFLPPTLLYYFYKIRNSTLVYSVKLGLALGLGSGLGLLLAPYYGAKAYFTDLRTLQWHGEIVW